MRGVYKRERKEFPTVFIATYSDSKRGIGPLKQEFKTNSEAEAQRKKWINQYGFPLPSHTKNRIDEIHGEWKIIKYLGKSKWLVRSEVDGREKQLSSYSLKEGTTPKSIENLVGQKFGELTVLGATGERNKATNSMQYVVQDNLGNAFVTSARMLKNNGITGYKKSKKGREKSRQSMNNLNKNRNEYLEKRGYKNGTVTWAKDIKRPTTNTSGYKGVSFSKRYNKWRSYITCKGKRHDLGSFENKQDAINARKSAEQKYFK